MVDYLHGLTNDELRSIFMDHIKSDGSCAFCSAKYERGFHTHSKGCDVIRSRDILMWRIDNFSVDK